MVSPNPKNVVEAALRLPEDERIRLAERLWLSVDAEHRDALESPWDREIDRRIAEARRDPSRLVDGEDVILKLKAGRKP